MEDTTIQLPSQYLTQIDSATHQQQIAVKLAPNFTKKADVKSEPTFMTLPLELRRQIYGYCLVKPSPIPVHRLKRWKQAFEADSESESLKIGEIGLDRFRKLKPFVWNDNKEYPWAYSKELGIKVRIEGQNKSLLLVSRQIGGEALQVLYRDDQFVYAVDPHYTKITCYYTSLTSSFSVSNLKTIRKLLLILQFDGDYRYDIMEPTGLEKTPHKAGVSQAVLWAPILDSLTKMELVVKYPWRRGREYTSWTAPLETRQQNYLAWLEATLKFLQEHASKDLKFDIDFGNRAEVRSIVEKYLLGRYRLIKTGSGDKFYDQK